MSGYDQARQDKLSAAEGEYAREWNEAAGAEGAEGEYRDRLVAAAINVASLRIVTALDRIATSIQQRPPG
jgi:hypothetical protein